MVTENSETPQLCVAVMFGLLGLNVRTVASQGDTTEAQLCWGSSHQPSTPTPPPFPAFLCSAGPDLYITVSAALLGWLRATEELGSPISLFSPTAKALVTPRRHSPMLLEVIPKGYMHCPASIILFNFCTDDSELSWKHSLVGDYTKPWWPRSSRSRRGCQVLVSANPGWSASRGGVCGLVSHPPH